jgi:hypothetical protein
MYKTGMIAMLSNSLIEQLNVNGRTCHIAMKFVSADSFCSVVWWGAACAEVSTGSLEASKARLGHMAPGTQEYCMHFSWKQMNNPGSVGIQRVRPFKM